jgi:hypothetical protein
VPPTNRVFPDQPIIHRPVGGALAAGVRLLASGVAHQVTTVAGATRWRIRIKVTHAATLSAKYCKPDQPQDAPVEYGLFGPADVVLVANTENHMDVDPHFGEALVRLTLTNTAGAVCDVTECDLMAVHVG